VQGSHSDANANAKNDQSKDEEDDRPGPGKLRSHTGHFSAVRTPGKGIVEGVEEEGVMAMRTSDPAHSRHLRDRNRCGRGRRQVDDPLTVGSGTSNPLRASFADEETVTRTSHILSARRGISDGRGLIARVALHHMLVLLPRDVNHCLADPAGDHRDASSLLIRRGQLVGSNNGTLADNWTRRHITAKSSIGSLARRGSQQRLALQVPVVAHLTLVGLNLLQERLQSSS